MCIRDRGRSSVNTVRRQGLGTSSRNTETPGKSHFSGTVVSHGRKKSPCQLKEMVVPRRTNDDRDL